AGIAGGLTLCGVAFAFMMGTFRLLSSGVAWGALLPNGLAMLRLVVFHYRGGHMESLPDGMLEEVLGRGPLGWQLTLGAWALPTLVLAYFLAVLVRVGRGRAHYAYRSPAPGPSQGPSLLTLAAGAKK
ncbi:MAG: hypothetical protein ACYS9X_25925, partial [Planctomycetota bacterium]